MRNLFHKVTSALKVDGFPQYTRFTDSLESIRKSEVLMIDGLYKAFSDTLSRVASSQKSGISEPLADIKEVGTNQRNIIKEAYEPLSRLPTDVKPLLDQQTEMSRWRDMLKKAEDQAQKSKTAAEKAEVALQRAKLGGRPTDIGKAESNFSIAQRRADDDQKSASDQRDSLEKKEEPYKVKFLESYVTPIKAAVEIRIKEAESLQNLFSDFNAANEKFHEIEEEESITQLKKELEKLQEVVIE